MDGSLKIDSTISCIFNIKKRRITSALKEKIKIKFRNYIHTYIQDLHNCTLSVKNILMCDLTINNKNIGYGSLFVVDHKRFRDPCWESEQARQSWCYIFLRALT